MGVDRFTTVVAHAISGAVVGFVFAYFLAALLWVVSLLAGDDDAIGLEGRHILVVVLLGAILGAFGVVERVLERWKRGG